MPIIEEQKLENLYKEINVLKDSNQSMEVDLEEAIENVDKQKKHKTILSVLLGISLLGLILLSTLIFTAPRVLLPKKLLKNENTIHFTQTELDSIVQERIAVEKLNNSDDEDTSNTTEKSSFDEQVIYAVQIGAFESNNISLLSDNLIQFNESYKNEFYKYSVGAFSSLEEAQQFRKELVHLGFDDAFIASYQNGKRLHIEEAY